MTDLLITGDPSELEQIRIAIEQTIGSDADLEAINSTASGELREPLLIGVIVALGGPAIVTALVRILRDRTRHAERMLELENADEESRRAHEEKLEELRLRGEREQRKWELQLMLIEKGEKMPVTLDELALQTDAATH